MSGRKLWTKEEDKVLKYLKEQKGYTKWSQMARQMQQQFGMTDRTGKQCRQRYHNHLDNAIVSDKWSSYEEEVLFEMHSEVGNRWSLIAQRLVGRSDNCVKNHFYSKLRRSLRKLNKVVQQEFKSMSKEVRVSTLYRILQICQSKFQTNDKYDQDQVEACLELKNKLYQLEPLLQSKVRNQEQRVYIEGVFFQLQQLSQIQSKGRKVKRVIRKQADMEGQNYSKTEEGQEVIKEQPAQAIYKMFKRICEEMILQKPK